MLLALKKLWSLVRNYWYIPAILIAIVVLTILMGGRTPNALINAFRKARETHRKEVETIDRIHAEEIKKRNQALVTFHKRMAAIEMEYADQQKELDQHKLKEIEKLVKANADDPTELTKRIAEATGFEFVLPGDAW